MSESKRKNRGRDKLPENSCVLALAARCHSWCLTFNQKSGLSSEVCAGPSSEEKVGASLRSNQNLAMVWLRAG